jgi:hypothetical protein
LPFGQFGYQFLMQGIIRLWYSQRHNTNGIPARSKQMQTPRTVLVTGGNRGIGFAIAEEFVSAGYKVAVTARSGSGPAGSLTVRADVTDSASLDEAIAQV